jgi:hypothetical protein
MLNHPTDISPPMDIAPDWRALRAARRFQPYVMRVCLNPRDRDAFYRRAYVRDHCLPNDLLGSFAEAYAAGTPIPQSCDAAMPANTGVVSRMPIEVYERVKARALAEGMSISAAMRGFILAYARAEITETA